jgi:hypothetical protein
MNLFPRQQSRKVRCVVGHQHEAVINGPADDRPILPCPESEPSDMGRFQVAACPSIHEFGAQAFIDEKLHAASSSVSVSEDFGALLRQGAFTRGWPRCG